jgi:NitT/TauT family transport system substrate-binding protein
MIARGTMSGEVDWRLFGTGPAIVDAFAQEEIDLAYIGLPPAIIGIGRGVNIQCIAGGHIEGTVICGGNELKAFPAVRDLDQILKQFIGARIGVPGRGSIHDVIISECLRQYDLQKEVEIINYPWADQVLDAFHRGDVSAAVGTPALAVAVMHYAGGMILYPPSRLWPSNPSYGILVQGELLKEEPEKIEEFLIAHEEATALFRNDPLQAARTISDYVGIVDESFVLDTLKVSPKYCAGLTGDYMASSMEFVKVLKGLGYIDRDIPSDEIFDTTLIGKVHAEKDHYDDGISSAV